MRCLPLLRTKTPATPFQIIQWNSKTSQPKTWALPCGALFVLSHIPVQRDENGNSEAMSSTRRPSIPRAVSENITQRTSIPEKGIHICGPRAIQVQHNNSAGSNPASVPRLPTAYGIPVLHRIDVEQSKRWLSQRPCGSSPQTSAVDPRVARAWPARRNKINNQSAP